VSTAFNTLLTDDLPALFADFGEDFTHGGTTVQVIYESGPGEDEGGVHDERSPEVLMQTADFDTLLLDHGDTVTLRSTSHWVEGIDHQGDGLTVLSLRRS